METELVIVKGKVCFLLPPVREGKKPQISTARATLSSDNESVTVTCRGYEKILGISQVGEPQESDDFGVRSPLCTSDSRPDPSNSLSIV